MAVILVGLGHCCPEALVHHRWWESLDPPQIFLDLRDWKDGHYQKMCRPMATFFLLSLDILFIHLPQSIQLGVQHISFRVRHKSMPAPLNAGTQISSPL